jgi:UDP-glucose 4-epimerase
MAIQQKYNHRNTLKHRDMEKILVTGGAGFVGTNLVKDLRQQGHTIVVLDNYSAGKVENEIEGVVYIREHTKNINNIDLPFIPSIIFHLGEYSRIHPSFEDYEKVWQYNTVGTFEVLNFCKKHNIKIVYAASSTRFAQEGIDHSPYSLTKSMSIDLVRAFAKWYGVQYSICYFYNVFGPGYDSSPVPGYESVISVFEKQYKAGTPLTVSGDGQQKRMFTYVGDIVDGLIKSWRYVTNDEFELGNPIKSYTILEIAKMFSDNIQHIEARRGDRVDSTIHSYDDTCRKLNWAPTVSVEDWVNSIK